MRTLIVVAHCDDETLGCFSLLEHHGGSVEILHVTDSAPLDPEYARKSGYGERESYRAARRRELDEVFRIAGFPREQYHCLGIPDLEAAYYTRHIRTSVEAFRADRIYTHAYEGGHPDHDAIAYALAGLPGLWEFPLYHGKGGLYTTHSFLDGEAEVTVNLIEKQRRKKQEWLNTFSSQKSIIDGFAQERELFRPARNYDFAAPPHEGEIYFSTRHARWSWQAWRQAVENPRL